MYPQAVSLLGFAMPTVIKRCLALIIFLVLYNFIWSYLWYLTDASPNPGVLVVLPKLIDLLNSYIGHTRQLADVNWHTGLIVHGYEHLNSSEAGFDWSWQRNWAYFPLQPYLARPLTWLGISPIIALLINSFLGAATLTLMCVGIVDRDHAFSDQGMRVALLMLFFIIPPLGLMTNFVVLPAAIFVAAYLTLRQILSEAQAAPLTLLLGSAAILIASGLSRVQGIVFDVLIVVAFVSTALCSRPARAKPSTIGLFIASAVMPIVIVAAIFQVVAKDPLAFQKIQVAWGRTWSAPWKPIIEAFKLGGAVNFGSGTELPFTIIRLGVFIIVAVVGLGYWARAIQMKSGESALVVFDGCVLLIGLALIALPLMTSTLMSAHRYMTCAAIVVAATLKLGWRPSWILISLLLLIRMGEFVLFSRGYLFLIW